VILTIDNTINDDEEEKLLFAWEHFRHGPRNPYTQINKTTWIDFIGVQWKNEGELSALGLRSHYLLGVATKNRYENFLSKSFDTNEIFIISTDVNRTITSAMSNLQGIYRNYTTPNLTIEQIDNAKIKGLNGTYEQKINEKIEELKKSYIKDGISIMPIHLFSRVGLQFKLNDNDFCPGIIKYKEESKNQKDVKKIVKEFKASEKEIRACNFSKDGKFLMTASFDKKISIFDINDDMKLVKYLEHDDRAVNCKWHPDKPIIASSSADNTARIWTPKVY
jgi:WD40 repeat protein